MLQKNVQNRIFLLHKTLKKKKESLWTAEKKGILFTLSVCKNAGLQEES